MVRNERSDEKEGKRGKGENGRRESVGRVRFCSYSLTYNVCVL